MERCRGTWSVTRRVGWGVRLPKDRGTILACSRFNWSERRGVPRLDRGRTVTEHATHMGKKSKSNQVIALKRDTVIAWVAFYDRTISLARTCTKTAGVVLAFRYIMLTVQPFAGHETKVDAVVGAVLKLGADRWFAYAVCGIFGVAWWKERKLRGKTIENMGDHIKQLEQRLDPNRSSSGLTTKGRPKRRTGDD